MGKVTVLAGVAVAAGLLFSATQSLAAVTVGNASPYGSNCYPFSCAGRYGITQYQEDYNSAAFSGLTSFNQISFKAASGYAGDKMDPATYSVSFYLTPNATLSSNLASNEGTLLGSFGTFSLTGPLPSTLSLRGSTINYDPSMGDLLMEVTVTGVSNAGNPLGYFAGDLFGASVNRAYVDSRGASAGAGGLMTSFAAVPEPATWAMMIMGFGLLGLALRRRSAAAAVAA